MKNRIIDVFASILQASPEEIHDGLSPEQVEKWDSFHHLFLVAGFEEEFGIEIEPEEIVEMYKDFRSFRRIIEKKVNGTMQES